MVRVDLARENISFCLEGVGGEAIRSRKGAMLEGRDMGETETATQQQETRDRRRDRDRNIDKAENLGERPTSLISTSVLDERTGSKEGRDNLPVQGRGSHCRQPSSYLHHLVYTVTQPSGRQSSCPGS